MLVKTPLRVVPSPLTATMMAIEMPAAISQYSIAVAPVSSAIKAAIILRISNLPRFFGVPRRRRPTARTIHASNGSQEVLQTSEGRRRIFPDEFFQKQSNVPRAKPVRVPARRFASEKPHHPPNFHAAPCRACPPRGRTLC
jgi:hypothetical protein